MTLPRRFTIAESSHQVLNPVTPTMLDELGHALPLDGRSMLDLACGKGELLCRWAKDHAVTGTGVDIHGPFLEAARARATELGVSEQLTFAEADASSYVAEQPVDIAACIGATWIGDGTVGTLELLSRSLKPGGMALVGECYWRETPPDDAAAEQAGAGHVSDYGSLADLLESCQGAGWDVVEMIHASEQSWDRYVAAQWLSLRRFVDEHPDDELVPELRAELAQAPVQYARYQRRYMGWGILALMRR